MSGAAQLPIRLVLSDIDGTLLRPDHSFGDKTLAAFAQLREAGVALSLASARPPLAMRKQIAQLGIEVPVAAFNGGTLMAADGSYIKVSHLHPDAARIALALFARHPVAVWLFADDQWLVRDRSAAYMQKERDVLGYDEVVVPSFEPYLDRVDKIVATSADFDLLIKLEQALLPRIEGRALASRSQDYYLDVTDLAANKGDALASLADYLGVDLAQTAALGDGGNDIPMFRRAGFSVAMGQSSDEVKRHASAVTGSNAEEGAADAITRMILPRGRSSS
ncbi:HAD family hydrolase [Pseudomonas sp. HR96]|uniref:HAD family hydrolase n=1 Tax=Pseudomonas sp. HR96 TaxID=1027966 RepID=UPI002A7553A1|nr:HAD family hydrolase [Pseudomonas sp. HR96]WPO97982.1 HAD family hydrolase [Pseudomonas sp. HR96]